MSLPRFIAVTGTDTGVGKTVTTAALAAALQARGRRVVMLKPVQTGHISADDPDRAQLEACYSDVVTVSDAQIVAGLTGIRAHTHVTFRLPMAPVPAAAAEDGHGRRLPSADEHAAWAQRIGSAARADHVLIEGSGGLLVDFGDHTIADVASRLSAAVIVVTRSRLGTLNHTALTIEALAARGLTDTSLVIGDWPPAPLPVDADNRRRLSELAPLLGAVPAQVGTLQPAAFCAAAPRWLPGLD